MDKIIKVNLAEKKLKRERKKRRRRILLASLSICTAFSCGLLIGIHWRVIKALINGEELPTPPKWHQRFCKKHRTE